MEAISSNLGYEACTFIKVSGNQGEIIASIDESGPVDCSEKPPYKFGEKSRGLTNLVYLTKEPVVSDNLKADVRNSHHYDERVKENHDKNWCGVPVFRENELIGILRVKNKTSLDDANILAPIILTDVQDLTVIANLAGSLLRLDYEFDSVISKSKKLEQELERVSAHQIIVEHEIATPISVFGTRPERLRREVSRIAPDHPETPSLLLLIDDLQSLGNRLKYVAETFGMDALSDFENIEMNQSAVMRDIIIPVLSVSKNFLEKKYRTTIQTNDNKLTNLHCMANPLLAQVVLNILIENAAKYSTDTPKPIEITRLDSKDSNFVELSVSSYGLSILPLEVARVFDFQYRGKSAEERQIAGRGIGLYLARKIMLAHGGDIRIESISNPVTVAFAFPKSGNQT